MKSDITAVLERCREQIRVNLEANGINASGRTSASLVVEEYDGGVRLKSDGSGAPIWTTEIGRAPGGMPPVDAIFQWSIDKGLSFDNEDERLSFAWAVARKIESSGYGRPSRSDYGSTEEVIYTEVVKETVMKVKDVARNSVKLSIREIINNQKYK